MSGPEAEGIPEIDGSAPTLQEAARELQAAEHDAQVAFDCIALGELERAHTSAVTARVEIDAALTALQAALGRRGPTPGGPIPGGPIPVGPAPGGPAVDPTAEVQPPHMI